MADPLSLFHAAIPAAGSALPAAKNKADASGSAAPAPLVNVDRATALRYLHGDAVVLPPDAPRGPVTLAYQGHALGPGKNIGARCNNLYPKSKRIRMDIA
jgi:NOL1/NOP2/fmu family ribosome biogenesis protein